MKQSSEEYKKKLKKKYMENPHANCGDKKNHGFKTSNMKFTI